MKMNWRIASWLIGAGLLVTAVSAAEEVWQDQFTVPADRFVSSGASPYFVLKPGHQMVYEGKEHGKEARLVITVLDETKKIDGVETRVVEERETLGGELEEVSRNYFAIDQANGDVYYFGEDVDTYGDGKVTGHEGSWQAGREGARYGLFMPAKPKVDQRFYQEIAPRKAMDRVRIISIDAKMKTPAGEFENCVKTEETSPLEPQARETKVYAPDVGLLVDGGLTLVKYGEKEKK